MMNPFAILFDMPPDGWPAAARTVHLIDHPNGGKAIAVIAPIPADLSETQAHLAMAAILDELGRAIDAVLGVQP